MIQDRWEGSSQLEHRGLSMGWELTRAGLLPHYLLDIDITLAVSEDYVRASLLPQLLQDRLQGTGRDTAVTCL